MLQSLGRKELDMTELWTDWLTNSSKIRMYLTTEVKGSMVFQMAVIFFSFYDIWQNKNIKTKVCYIKYKNKYVLNNQVIINLVIYVENLLGL